MPLIFEIEQKPEFKSKTVFGVEIPIYGELTVNEAIAVDRAIATDIDQTLPSSNTEWMIVQVAAWLSARLEVSKSAITAQLYKSKPLIDALWETYDDERKGNTLDYEIVTEGKEDIAPLMTLIESGMISTSDSQLADLRQNSLVILDSSVSA